MRISPFSALFFVLTLVLFSCGDTKEVEIAKELPLDELIEQYPDSALLFAKRGRIHLEKQDFIHAFSDAATAFRLDSTDRVVEKLYADVLNNRPERSVADVYIAQRHFQNLLAKDGKNTELLVAVASTFSQQQDFEKAFSYINSALKIDPKFRDAYIMKGSIYRVLGNTDLMKSSYETAIQQDPEFFEAYIMLGVIYQADEDPICIQYFETAMELLPGNTEAFYSLAYAKQHFGQEDEALEMYREMVKDTSDYYAAQAYFQLGSMKQFLKRELDSAIYFYGRATYVEPRLVEAHHNMGVCYDLNGEKSKALLSFGRALKYDEGFTLSREYADSIRFL